MRGLRDPSTEIDALRIAACDLPRPVVPVLDGSASGAGRGLSLRLSLGYGNSHSGLQKIWQQDVIEPDENAEDASMRVAPASAMACPHWPDRDCLRPTVR